MSNLDQDSENLFSSTGNKASTEDRTLTTTKKGNDMMKNLKENKRVTDLIKMVIIFAISLGIYIGAVAILPAGMSYFVRHLVAVIICLLFLWGYSIIQKEPSAYGGAIIIFLVLFFIFNVSSHYFINNDKDSSNSKEINISKEVRVETLNYGSTVFDMKAGEGTGLLSLPEGVVTHFVVASPSYDYIIEFSDGTSYRGSATGFIPEKQHPQFQIRAMSDQFVTITVTN